MKKFTFAALVAVVLIAVTGCDETTTDVKPSKFELEVDEPTEVKVSEFDLNVLNWAESNRTPEHVSYKEAFEYFNDPIRVSGIKSGLSRAFNVTCAVLNVNVEEINEESKFFLSAAAEGVSAVIVDALATYASETALRSEFESLGTGVPQ